jgi:hypothetical protein
MRISRGADRLFGFVPHEHPELGMPLYFEDNASSSEFLGQCGVRASAACANVVRSRP